MKNNAQPEPVDLTGYLLGEGTAAERLAAEAHLNASSEAREEASRLSATLAALQMLPQEEIPRRIAFVSDPVFQPSWWQRFWQSTPQLGFASAMVLAVAIGAHGWLTRPAPASAPAPMVATVSQPDFDQAVQKAVAQAVAQVEARQQAAADQKLAVALKATEKRFQTELQMLQAEYRENDTILRKQWNRMYVQNAGLVVGGNTNQ